MGFEEDIEAIRIKGVDKAARDMLKDVEEAYGEVPYIFQFLKDHPELLVTKILHNNAVFRSSKSLDLKTIELISIAVSAAIRCKHCLEMHIRVAHRVGVNDDEIAAAMLLAANMVNASVLATATREFDEGLEICRACQAGSELCEIHRERQVQESHGQ